MSDVSPALLQYPVSGTDGFVVGLDHLARAADGRGLDAVGQIDVARLRWLAAKLPRRVPLLHATLRKVGCLRCRIGNARAGRWTSPLSFTSCVA